MEDMARSKEFERNRSSDERLHCTAERTDQILVRLNDLSSKEAHVKSNVRELESRLELMEGRQSEMLDCMRQISSTLPMLLNALQGSHGGSPPQEEPQTPMTPRDH